MRLPARWTDKEGWDFHIFDTGIVRQCIEDVVRGEEVDISRAKDMVFRREWMENHGEGNPPNFDWLKERADILVHMIESGETPKPSVIERLVYHKWILYTLTKFKQDTAYRELMGGWVTLLALDPAPWTAAQTQEDRVNYLLKQRKWIDENYKRDRTKPWVLILIDEFISRYKSSEFVEFATNWMYDQIIENRKDWQIDTAYEPKNWYPVGRGYIQNKILGGRG